MANFRDEDDSHLSNRQTEKLLTTVRMPRFKIQSLSFAWPWKIWVRDKRVLRRKPKAKVAMLRLFREEHKYSLAFEKSFRLHCRESPIEAYLKERRRRTRRPWKIRFRSFFRNLFDSPRRRHLELPKRCWLKTYVRFLISLNKSIELNKIHHYFMCTSFAGRMNY